MKVRVSITVDIDAAAWEANYGIDASDKAAIRADVTAYVSNGVTDQLRDMGVLAS